MKQDKIMPNMKEIRAVTGLSQAKFGALFGIPMMNVAHWEQKKNIPPDYVTILIMRNLYYMGYDILHLCQEYPAFFHDILKKKETNQEKQRC